MRTALPLASLLSLSLSACAVIVLGPARELAQADPGTTGQGGDGGGPVVCEGDRVIWVRHFPNIGHARAYAAEPDAEGGVFIAGEFADEIDLGGGPLPDAGQVDMFLARFDADGRTVWSKRLGDSNPQNGQTRLTRTPDGGVLFAGNFQGMVDFGDGPEVATFGEAFIARYGAAGEHMWTWRSEGAGHEAVRKVAVTPGGDVVMAGQFEVEAVLEEDGTPLASAGGVDAFMALLDDGGNLVWQKRLGTSAEDSADWIAVDHQGRIVLAGRSQGNIDLGNGSPLMNAGSYDAFLAFYTLDGAHVSSVLAGDDNQQQTERVAIDPVAGHLIVGGQLLGSIGFGGEAVSAEYGLFLVRFDENGDEVLAIEAFDSLHPRFGLAVDGAGDSFIAGSFSDKLELGDGVAEATGMYDGFVARLGPSFEPIWSLTFGSAEEDEAISIALDAASNVFAVGGFRGSIELDGCPPLISAGEDDVILMKLAH